MGDFDLFCNMISKTCLKKVRISLMTYTIGVCDNGSLCVYMDHGAGVQI